MTIDADFSPVDNNCAVLLREGRVTTILATGEDVELYAIECPHCNETTTLVTRSSVPPICCPLCGNDVSDEDDEDADDTSV